MVAENGKFRATLEVLFFFGKSYIRLHVTSMFLGRVWKYLIGNLYTVIIISIPIKNLYVFIQSYLKKKRHFHHQ